MITLAIMEYKYKKEKKETTWLAVTWVGQIASVGSGIVRQEACQGASAGFDLRALKV